MAYLNKNVDAVRLQTAKKAYMYEGSVYNSTFLIIIYQLSDPSRLIIARTNHMHVYLRSGWQS